MTSASDRACPRCNEVVDAQCQHHICWTDADVGADVWTVCDCGAYYAGGYHKCGLDVVRKAQADALRAAADDLDQPGAFGSEIEIADWLRSRAADVEKGEA